jgi:hypothetical protein
MAKTYPAIGPFTAGDILTAATMTDVQTNLTNQRVPPMVKCTRSGVDSGYTAEKTVPWNGTDEYDTDGMHDPASNNERITFNTAGVYVVTFAVRISHTGSPAYLDALIRLNGSDNIGEDYRTPTASAYAAVVSITLNASVSDYVEARCQANGAASALFLDVSNAYFSATWIGQAS